MTVYIKKFDVTTIKPHRIILLVGKRGTGKSTLIRDLMYHIKHFIDLPFAMTPTEESTTMFEECMPRACIHNEASTNSLASVIAHQRKLGRKKLPQQHLLLVLDDMMFDKKVLKSLEMRDIFMNGRHIKLTFINAMQYVMDMGPDLRTQVDYVFALRENIISNLTKLWKYFFGMFTTFDDFAKTFKALTEDNGAIVIDNTVKSNQIKDCVFWYKADINIPQYKLGKSRYWKLSNTYYKTEEQIEESITRNCDDQRQGRITHIEKEEECNNNKEMKENENSKPISI